MTQVRIRKETAGGGTLEFIGSFDDFEIKCPNILKTIELEDIFIAEISETIDPNEFVSLLLIKDATSSEYNPEISEKYPEFDFDYDESIPGVVVRNAVIVQDHNRLQIIGIKYGSKIEPFVITPIYLCSFLWELFGRNNLLAYDNWYSEGPGPVSWEGEFAIFKIRIYLVFASRGDSQEDLSIKEIVSSETITSSVYSWLVDHGILVYFILAYASPKWENSDLVSRFNKSMEKLGEDNTLDISLEKEQINEVLEFIRKRESGDERLLQVLEDTNHPLAISLVNYLTKAADGAQYTGQLSSWGDFLDYLVEVPTLENTIAKFSVICWDSRTSGTDIFYLVRTSTNEYSIFSILGEGEQKITSLPKDLDLNGAIQAFFEFLQESEDIGDFENHSFVAYLHDLVLDENREQIKQEHPEANENSLVGEHYFGLDGFGITLEFNAPKEVLLKVLEAELIKLNEVIARKIRFKEYCYETADWAEPAKFNEHEWDLVDKYEQYKYTNLEDALVEYEAARNEILNYSDSVIKARELLGIQSDDLSGLLSKTKDLAERNPKLEAKYWEAFWVLKDQPAKKRFESAEKQKFLAEEIQNAVKVLHWPEDWKMKYAPIWLNLGGDGLTAERWHSKGWDIETLIYRQEIPCAWNGTLTERARNANPPEMLEPYYFKWF